MILTAILSVTTTLAEPASVYENVEGLAGEFVETLKSTSIHFVQMSLRWSLNNFPDRECSPPLRSANNGLVQNLYEEIHDFEPRRHTVLAIQRRVGIVGLATPKGGTVAL